jgi:hypothetical protein
MNTKIAKDFHLVKEQYLLGKVNWLVNDAEAWDSLCECGHPPTLGPGPIGPGWTR